MNCGGSKDGSSSWFVLIVGSRSKGGCRSRFQGVIFQGGGHFLFRCCAWPIKTFIVIVESLMHMPIILIINGVRNCIVLEKSKPDQQFLMQRNLLNYCFNLWCFVNVFNDQIYPTIGECNIFSSCWPIRIAWRLSTFPPVFIILKLEYKSWPWINLLINEQFSSQWIT